MLRYISAWLFFLGVVPTIVYGKFDNEFLRLSIMIIAISFNMYANLHWLLRACALPIHIFIVLVIETPYLRELLLQVACTDVGK
jgi:hypothetical protein